VRQDRPLAPFVERRAPHGGGIIAMLAGSFAFYLLLALTILNVLG
jgi:hypothetical protein